MPSCARIVVEIPRCPVKYAIGAFARSSRSGWGLVQPGTQLGRAYLVGTVDVHDVDQPQFAPGHRISRRSPQRGRRPGSGRW